MFSIMPSTEKGTDNATTRGDLMQFKLMDQVYISSDTLNYGAPVGEVGYVIAIDRHIDQCRPYLVRVPSRKDNWWLPECDLIEHGQWLASEADKTIHQALVNRALDTGNRELFNTLRSRGEVTT